MYTWGDAQEGQQARRAPTPASHAWVRGMCSLSSARQTPTAARDCIRGHRAGGSLPFADAIRRWGITAQRTKNRAFAFRGFERHTCRCNISGEQYARAPPARTHPRARGSGRKKLSISPSAGAAASASECGKPQVAVPENGLRVFFEPEAQGQRSTSATGARRTV
jgi:hypothetical protein